MLRRALLIALVCLSVWAAADRVRAWSPVPAGAASSAGSCQLAAPDHTDTSDRQWIAGRRSSASLTESSWRSRLQHAVLAAWSSPDGFAAVREAFPQRPARHASPHLHHIPLLI